MVKQQFWSLFPRPRFHKISPIAMTGLLATLISGADIYFAPESRGIISSQAQLFQPETVLERELLIAQTPLLQLGSEGPEVQQVQTLLQLLGYYPDAVDGQYQEETFAAVAAFQEAAGLSRDGIVGPTTWEKLLPSVSQMSDDQADLTPASASTASVATSSTAVNESEADPEEEMEEMPAGDSSPPENSVSTSTGTATTPPEDIRLPTLRAGMRGPAVRNLQERLSALGLLEGTIDGIFGSQTEASVKSAQRYFNLTPDGVVGAATWRALLQ